jgi:glycosyltransferase involved in cell wall biosynthesis
LKAFTSVLHIGNILNNGYLHCKYLRKRGVLSDSLNVDYRHCQGQPEWAEVYLKEPVDEFNPDWSRLDLGGFKRPDWFYDVALNEISDLANRLNSLSKDGEKIDIQPRPARNMWEKARPFIGTALEKYVRPLLPGPVDRLCWKFKARSLRNAGITITEEDRKALGENLIAQYKQAYPDRLPTLSVEDVNYWLPRGVAYTPMLRRYPLIQAYSLDPMYVLLGNPGQPFICYEHGTMREFPFEDSARGRLYSLCLKKAEKIIITNADCISSAKRLNLNNYVFIPHIIDDDLLKPEESPLRAKMLKETGSEFIFVAPSRHHWKHCPPGLENSWFKRNDILIRGLAKLFQRRASLKVLIIFFEWGQEVKLSKDLIRDCGFEDRVRWEPIQSKPAMKEFYNAADIILDQFNHGIGTFGAVVPEAMACAKPVLLNYKKELHTWCYPELPPALDAPDEDAIVKHLQELLDAPTYRQEIGQAGRQWFEKYHSSRVVIDRLIDVYMSISQKYNWGWELT